jgi:hypothetical protein
MTYLWVLATDSLHLLEGIKKGIGALLETLVGRVVLGLVLLVGLVSFFRRIDHAFDYALANNWRTEHDADELINLGGNLRIKANQLEIAASVAALSNHALADAVERDEFDIIELARLLGLQLAEALLE